MSIIQFDEALKKTSQFNNRPSKISPKKLKKMANNKNFATNYLNRQVQLLINLFQATKG